MKQLDFGFAREDITPAYGAPLCGYFNPRPNRGVYDFLSLKAAVFRTGDTCAAIVSYDLCELDSEFLDGIDNILRAAGSPLTDRVLYCATHTHTGPYANDLFDYAPDPKYLRELADKTVAALNRAYESLAPAELLAAETECTTLAFNRRFIMKNGRTLTNPGKLNGDIDHPEGGIDPKIILLEIRRNDRPVLLIANISNHTDTIGGDIVSADWPGVMEREIQHDLGFELPVMTVIAPQGNINHFDISTPGSQTGYDEARRIGKAYANVILSALYRLKKLDATAIAAARREFDAPYLELTDAEYAEAKKVYEENKDAVMADGTDFTSEDIARGVPAVKKFFAEMAIGCRENPISGRRVEKQMMISFGDRIAIVSMPAEPFVEIGNAIREGSRFPMTMLAALGMGAIGYVGLPRHYGNGGYETSPSRTLADRTVGETMIAGALELLNNR